MTAAYFRFPHLHVDLVTFVAEDDVWLAPLAGGRAWRLSADRRPARDPRLSPDGRWVAWTSTRDGDPEVYVAATEGGIARRLTYWGAPRTGVRGWTPDGEVLVASPTGQHASWQGRMYAAPLDGGPARRLPFGLADAAAFGPTGGVVISTPTGREPAGWKRYRGGNAAKLWVDRAGDGGFVRLLPGIAASLVSPMWLRVEAEPEGRIGFVSDVDGTADVYSVRPDGSGLRRHTSADFYVRQATSDGERVVYASAGDLWLLDALDAEPRLLQISVGGPRAGRQPQPVRPRRYLGGVSPDHTGRASAVEVRGTLHWVTHRDGPVRALEVGPGVRTRIPAVLGRTGQVAWVTDVDGDDAIEIALAEGREPGADPRRVASGQLGRVLGLVSSPDAKRLAIASHDGRLLVLDVDSGELREIARAEHGEVSDLVFSSDSAWLAWSHPGPEPLRQIRLARLSDLSTVDVTPLRFTDFSPGFTDDGKYLAFLSVRSFDPIYDAYVLDLSFPNACRPQLVTLAADTPSPFAPVREGRPIGNSSGDDKTESTSDKSDEPDDADAEKAEGDPPVRVDVDRIADRVVPFPVPAGRYSDLRTAKGGVLWVRDPLVGTLGDDLAGTDSEHPESTLERFDLKTRRTEVLAEGVDGVWVSGDGSRLVLEDAGALTVVPADKKVDGGKDSDDSVEVDLSRIRVEVDPAAEWRQMYDETGRLMRDNFWRADMGGVDWAGVLARYRPLVERVASHDDLVDVLWEVHGELNTSHAYVSGGDDGPTRPLGLLGADLARDADGLWRVTRVLPSEPSDPQARSPLTAPGVGVVAGDAILAVDGRPVDPLTGPAPLLVDTAGKPVELTVRSAAGDRRVVVVPLDDEIPLRYQAWVTGRRAHVHQVTGGRIGYLHVPDMVSSGWAQLHRDLRVEVGRDGLIVDVRANRGGRISELVIEKIAQRVIGWDLSRGYRPMRYPTTAPRGPIVAVTDEWSGSDGDIVTAAIKTLGIGPVVGTRTWGGVIGIDMKYRLVDGTSVTQPRYSFWMEGPGWGIENHGVDPDVEVHESPQDIEAGRDPQLDTAIRLALEALAERPAAAPPELPPPGSTG